MLRTVHMNAIVSHSNWTNIGTGALVTSSSIFLFEADLTSKTFWTEPFEQTLFLRSSKALFCFALLYYFCNVIVNDLLIFGGKYLDIASELQIVSLVLLLPRRGFLSEAVPVMLQGIGGPGAPHHFEFRRRSSMGILLVKKNSSDFSNFERNFWVRIVNEATCPITWCGPIQCVSRIGCCRCIGSFLAAASGCLQPWWCDLAATCFHWSPFIGHLSFFENVRLYECLTTYLTSDLVWQTSTYHMTKLFSC